jgi:mono/diheme cytochrome c family protein
MKLSVSLLGALAIALICDPVEAQDRQAGLALARRVCADCHAVERFQTPSPKPGAPTFQQLASTPGMTSAALTVAFTTPHAGMPMYRLSPEQADDLIAYILSLR